MFEEKYLGMQFFIQTIAQSLVHIRYAKYHCHKLSPSLSRGPRSSYFILSRMGARCNTSSVRKLKEANSTSTALLKEKFDVYLQYIKSFEQHLGGIEDQTKANSEDDAEPSRAVGTFVDTANVLENPSRLH